MCGGQARLVVVSVPSASLWTEPLVTGLIDRHMIFISLHLNTVAVSSWNSVVCCRAALITTKKSNHPFPAESLFLIGGDWMMVLK